MKLLSLLVVVAALLLIAVVSADASKHHHLHRQGQQQQHEARIARRTNITDAHPTTLDRTLPSREHWAPIRAALEARNYSRPARSSLSAPDSGYFGVDVPVWVGEDTWTCLKNNGYSFAIVRAGQSNCVPDQNGVHTVANAWASGIAHVDIYIFPAFTCSLSASQQVIQTLNYMGDVPFGTLWFDIEQNPGSNWGTDPAANHAWLLEGINQASSMIGAARIGIYSSKWGWVPMGDYADLSRFPLWWANYDNDPSFGDFVQFAGWSVPSMKQFNDDSTICGLYTDVDSY